VIEKATTIKNHGVDPSGSGSLANDFAHGASFRGLCGVGARSIDDVLFQVAGGEDGVSSIIINQLGVDMRG
jgi:hypothetical protein